MSNIIPRIVFLVSLICGILGIPAVGSEIRSDEIQVSAFNIEVFGVTKMEDPEVVSTLVKIISRYDLIFIQEIRDKSEKAIADLLVEVNIANSKDPFKMALSDRLGSTVSKEQYAYMYRPSKLTLLQTYHWEDITGIFERTPYVAKFSYNGAELKEFGFIGIHVRPDAAPREIDALVDVYDDMVRRWNMKDFIIGGDFNAGCRYVTRPEWEKIRLRHDERFRWLIDDDTSTMVDSDCPYDRHLISGDGLRNGGYKEGSAKPYHFDDDMDLSVEKALDVSDHLPIDLVLK